MDDPRVNRSLENLQEVFGRDVYGAQVSGCKLVSWSEECCVCEMPITPDHLNMHGGVMGGAIFTLVDFAQAAAVVPFVGYGASVSASIEFVKAPKGTKLIATSYAMSTGRTLTFTKTEVRDDTGRLVAISNFTNVVARDQTPRS